MGGGGLFRLMNRMHEKHQERFDSGAIDKTREPSFAADSGAMDRNNVSCILVVPGASAEENAGQVAPLTSARKCYRGSDRGPDR